MKPWIRIVIFFLVIAVLVGGGLYATTFFKKQSESRIPADAVSAEFPLKDGSFVIMQMGPSGPGVHTSPLEKYALDIVKAVSVFSIFDFSPKSLENNATFGTPIYSPCHGNVKNLQNDVPDQPIGVKKPQGNSITIECNGFDIYMAHEKQGSIVVKEGDIVQAGQLIAQIGNTGNSDGPHLHFSAYRQGPNPDDKTPLPMVFGGRFLQQGSVWP